MRVIIVPPNAAGNGIDKYVESLLPAQGYAADVGANNGVCLSNTKLFEDKGWTVLCVEPNPDLSDEGRKNRKLWVQAACGPEDKDAVTFVACGVYPWAAGSGMRTAKGDLAENDMPQKPYQVPMRTLNRLLAEAKFPRLDYLTVDVEWYDLEVLQGIDLSVWKPKVVVVEAINERVAGPIIQHMTAQGYSLIHKIEFDHVFLRRDMRIALYTMHRVETIGDMVAITLPNKLEYCERNSYDIHVENWSGNGWPGFERLPALNYILRCGHYDWIFWLGTDCLITNMATRLESLADENYGMVIATDSNELQMDSFLVQRGKGGLEILESVSAIEKRWMRPNFEQSALEEMRKTPRFKDTLKIVPQRTMNSYRLKWYGDLKQVFDNLNLYVDRLGTPSEWQPGDFVFHIPGRAYETKLNALREMVPLVKR